MNLSLLRLPPEGRRFEHQYEAGELDLDAHEFRLDVPPLVTGRVDRAGMDVRVRGQLKARLLVPCDRCLIDVPFEIDQPFDLFYTPLEESTNLAAETELQERDLGFSVYEGEEIDLDELVREQLELALPTRILCREDCRGLCDQCGADLNLGECSCAKPVDPRWQALADLREREMREFDAAGEGEAEREAGRKGTEEQSKEDGKRARKQSRDH